MKEKTLPSFTGREGDIDISSRGFLNLSVIVLSKALVHFFGDLRKLCWRELFEGKLKVMKKMQRCR